MNGQNTTQLCAGNAATDRLPDTRVITFPTSPSYHWNSHPAGYAPPGSLALVLGPSIRMPGYPEGTDGSGARKTRLFTSSMKQYGPRAGNRRDDLRVTVAFPSGPTLWSMVRVGMRSDTTCSSRETKTVLLGRRYCSQVGRRDCRKS